MTLAVECKSGPLNRRSTASSSRWAAWSVALAALLAVSGCYAHETAYVEAEVPAHVEMYPSTYYQGHVVYLIGDRWYAHRHGRWVYYEVEPRPLYRYRMHIDRAPRAHPRHYDRRHWRYRESAPGYVAPPARRVAPPARRVH